VQYQGSLGADAQERAAWTADREAFIQRRACGMRFTKGGRSETATKRHKETTLKSKQARQQRLLPPKSKFWPLKLYENNFGNPKSAKNKKLGHKVTMFGEHRGVLVPEATDFNKPWDVEVGYLDETALEEELAVQLSDDSEDFPDELQNKYTDLVAADDRTFANACVGISYEDMMAKIAAEAAQESNPAAAGRQMAEDRAEILLCFLSGSQGPMGCTYQHRIIYILQT